MDKEPARLQSRTVIREVAGIQRTDQRAVIRAVDGHLSTGRFDELMKKIQRVRNRLIERIGKPLMIQFAQPHRQKINAQDEAMIVERVHRIRAVAEDMNLGLALQQAASQRTIFFGLLQFGEECPSQPQSKRLADGVIAARGDGEINVAIHSVSLCGDHLRQLGDASPRGTGRVFKRVQPKAPGQHAQRGLLSAFPIRAALGRIFLRPIFHKNPEGFGVAFV